MFLDNLKRFRAEKRRRRVGSMFFTSRRKTGTYGERPGHRGVRAAVVDAISHSRAGHVSPTIYD